MADVKDAVTCIRTERLGHSRAFTMLELLIVIGVLAILTAIVLPASTYLIENQRRANTLTNMSLIKLAIEEFQTAKPLGKSQTYFGSLPPDYFVWKKWRPLPPCPDPYGCWEVLDHPDLNKDGIWEPGEPVHHDQPDRDDEGFDRYNPGLTGVRGVAEYDGIQRRMSGVWVPEDPLPFGDTPIAKNYRSIESLYFYINRLCPTGSQFLSRLPTTTITNDDVCEGFSCPERVTIGIKDPLAVPTERDPKGEVIALSEIRDSWRNPLRYQVQRLGTGNVVNWRWVLRSAGPDGEFASLAGRAAQPISALMFEDPDKSDDIVLTGE